MCAPGSDRETSGVSSSSYKDSGPTGLHLYYLYSLPKAASPNTLTLELGVLTFRALTFEFSQKGHRQLITGGYFWITEF